MFKAGLTATALLMLMAGAATSSDYPIRTITLIVPFSAGGPSDVTARIVVDHMSRTLGQQIVIENVGGAGGTTGTARAASSEANGYTFALGHMGTHGAAAALYPNLKYHPINDFAPIGLIAGAPIVIVAKKDLPPQSLKEFIAYLKSGNKVTQAHSGIGSVSQTTCALFSSQVGVTTTAAIYRSTGNAINDLIGGQVDFMCDMIMNVVPQVSAGSIKAYAVATSERTPSLPNVPTTKEAGYPDFQVSAWNAFFAPKGTPSEAIAKLSAALDKALDDETVRKRLVELGSVLPDKKERTPAALATLVQSEMERWSTVLKGITISGAN